MVINHFAISNIMILDELEPTINDASEAVAEESCRNDVKRGDIYAVLAPGYISDDPGDYEKFREYIIDVLVNVQRIYNVKVYERQSLLGYPQFEFEFSHEFKRFIHVLRFFRTLFSIIAYLKSSKHDVEHGHIYINKNFTKEELGDAPGMNLYNLTGPHSNIRILENVSECVFKIKRLKGNVAVIFNYGYRLVKIPKNQDSNTPKSE